MKLISSFVILLSAMQISAQNPQLYEHTWYLEDLIIDGVSNPPPQDNEGAIVSLRFDESLPDDLNFETAICLVVYNEVIYNNPESSFEFVQEFQAGGLDCTTQEALDYQLLYFDFYYLEDTDPFSYEIIDSPDKKTLIITSNSGNQAIYSSELLSTKDNDPVEINIYPNPTINELFIDSSRVFNSVKLFDLFGKKIPVVLDAASNSIDLSQVAAGFYVLNFYFGKQTITKSIIKR